MTDSKLKSECLQVFEKVENQRTEIFDILDSMNDEQRHFKAESGKWNSLQISLHLMTAEKLTLIYMKRKVKSNQLEKAGLLSKFRLLVLKVAFRLPFKYTAPKTTDSTGEEPDYETLKSDWMTVRSELKYLIQNLDEKILRGEIFRHPRVGMLNTKQSLDFMGTHIAHHKKQILALMNHPFFPE